MLCERPMPWRRAADTLIRFLYENDLHPRIARDLVNATDERDFQNLMNSEGELGRQYVSILQYLMNVLVPEPSTPLAMNFRHWCTSTNQGSLRWTSGNDGPWAAMEARMTPSLLLPPTASQTTNQPPSPRLLRPEIQTFLDHLQRMRDRQTFT